MAPPAFRLTDRDLELVRAVARFGVLKSTHLDRLFPEASRQKVRRRLQTLYHAGYLERPKAQVVTMLMRLGTQHYAYTLGGGYQEFRVRAGMMGAKEPRHAATQRASYP